MSLRIVHSTFRIGRIKGIPIGLHISWFLSAALIVGVLGYDVYPTVFPDGDLFLHWSLAVAGATLFFVSILVHELAHSLLALRVGIPVRGITLFVFGGVSQITRDASNARTEFAIAIVGPLTSLLIAVAMFLAWLLAGFDESSPVGVTIEILMLMNLALGIFNLIPAFPMDGGRVFRALLWGITRNFIAATRWASFSGRGLAYLMIALGVVSFIDLEVVPIKTDQWSGFWLVLVGLFLESSARAGYTQARLIDTLRAHSVGEVMSHDLATVGGGISLEDVVSAHMTRDGQACLFVTGDDGAVQGLVTPREVRAVPRAKWPQTSAADVMVAVTQVPVTSSESDVATTLQRMENDDLLHMPVVDDGRLIGIVDRVNMVRFIQQLRTQRA